MTDLRRSIRGGMCGPLVQVWASVSVCLGRWSGQRTIGRTEDDDLPTAVPTNQILAFVRGAIGGVAQQTILTNCSNIHVAPRPQRTSAQRTSSRAQPTCSERWRTLREVLYVEALRRAGLILLPHRLTGKSLVEQCQPPGWPSRRGLSLGGTQ